MKFRNYGTTEDEPVKRVKEVKEKFDDVLDNLNFIVNGVISRDNMMLKCISFP